VFADPVPDQLNVVDVACIINGQIYLPPPHNTHVAPECRVGSLAAGESASLIWVAIPIANIVQSEAEISNSAYISETGTTTTDPNTANNQDYTTVTFIF
jgi:hypothetical protein